ncbi:hypothetical protein JOD54_006174 [Actinokineospora baliensis]|uniref:hypothetical protein n=1 Tax=Actinokineospora baliensis TaxID=547056 RepID=UPI00195EC3C4|nr:hypothetical protein [Actinokineospora baliensis]MBM7775970.1 hypothetical protein [Actinokineospora baliensis]
MRRTTALAGALLIAAGTLVATTTTASAHEFWGRYHIGVYHNRAECDADSDNLHRPPYMYTDNCYWWDQDPGDFGSRNDGPGWYFYVREDIH